MYSRKLGGLVWRGGDKRDREIEREREGEREREIFTGTQMKHQVEHT